MMVFIAKKLLLDSEITSLGFNILKYQSNTQLGTPKRQYGVELLDFSWNKIIYLFRNGRIRAITNTNDVEITDSSLQDLLQEAKTELNKKGWFQQNFCWSRDAKITFLNVYA